MSRIKTTGLTKFVLYFLRFYLIALLALLLYKFVQVVN